MDIKSSFLGLWFYLVLNVKFCHFWLIFITSSNAVGGKTGKTSVLPGFSKIEHRGSSDGVTDKLQLMQYEGRNTFTFYIHFDEPLVIHH